MRIAKKQQVEAGARPSGMGIEVKSPQELAIMRKAGRIVAATLTLLVERIKPGLLTEELDKLVVEEFKREGAVASFKGYRGYPASVCVSVNDEVVHGIPGKRALQEGDIVSLDLGAIYQGFHGDAALTVGVGRISPQAQRLIDISQEALEVATSAAVEGARLGDLSWAVQSFVEETGFSVVREYAGHGIGRELHEEPQVPNFGQPGRGPFLRKGMTLAIEPMVNAGGWRTKVLENRWTVCTLDGSLSAHFEHTIAIMGERAEILTRLN